MPAFDKKDKSRYETFSRRMLLLTSGMSGIFAILAGRLYQLQIVQGDIYMTRAEDNRISQRLIAAPRGRIFDRFGVPLASNRRNYRVLLVPEQAEAGVEATLDALAKAIPLDERARARVLRQVAVNKSFTPITVAENLNWNDFARLNLDLPYLDGIQPDISETRDYPFAGEFSHVLGYVASVAPEDKQTDDDPLLDVPGFRIGKRGIEKAFDTSIRGQGGVSRVEVNAYGRVIRELGREPGQNGEDVYLTVDRELQNYMYERLKDESAAATVMDVQNGDVLALVSTPGFDPNAFNVGITPEEWKALIENDHKPLMNKALSGVYPPGSTFKTVTSLAALASGLSPDFSVVCTGAVTLGNHQFHCWKKGGHGRMTLRSGLQHSCDSYFYTVAMKIGIDQIQQTAEALGLGSPTGIEIPGERGGLIPSRAWKQANFKEAWQQGETLNTGIGQGYVLTTPLQLCTLAARLASGKKVSPRLVHSLGVKPLNTKEFEPLNFSDEHLAIVRDAMNAVVNEGGGTAYSWRITEAGFEMAGKTGTAQVRRISAEERAGGVRSNESLPWKLRDHALFIAFAPIINPRYACSVVIEHGSTGPHPQVQLARDALLMAQKSDLVNRPTAYPVKSADIARVKL